jgi:hypothetical protein
MSRATIRLHVPSSAPRRQEPLTTGVPFARGELPDVNQLRLFNEAGDQVPLQAEVLEKWSDGSARWVLCDWQATWQASAEFNLGTDPDVPQPTGEKLVISDANESWNISTGICTFTLIKKGSFFLEATSVRDPDSKILNELLIQSKSDVRYHFMIESSDWSCRGPLRSTLRLEGKWIHEKEKFAESTIWLHFFANSGVVRYHWTIRNPKKADHPGGLWDLGNGGSIYLKQASSGWSWVGRSSSELRASAELEGVWESTDQPITIHQESSGGENWRSRNHLNCKREVPLRYKGYRWLNGTVERDGIRATPIIETRGGSGSLAVCLPYFWQNFPKTLRATKRGIELELFPSDSAEPHEIQGGEQKTHVFHAAFFMDGVTEDPLDWVRDDVQITIDPEWIAKSQAIPYLTPKETDPNTLYLELVDQVLDSSDTFDHKREVIDEYGWRHFGEIYGDHEAVFNHGSSPLISHYNNQYDPVNGLGCQYLRSADYRWFRLMRELAYHVIDIDLYHTDEDKSAYNHGLFWHTFHYVDADTGTHRTYPKNGIVPNTGKPVPGGGPANEQNYATGLMNYYYLTGDELSRDAAVSMAQWVIDMDDPKKTIFRWLSLAPTGLASSSRTPDYHGPGRGPANSISALLDGFRLTCEPKFLAKAEELIRRCVHPGDNVTARNLLDAENRWFYTMFLQSLGKYLDCKAEMGQLDFMYDYAHSSLLRYARWMADYEYPYLDKPERLEYPTETWAAQDMRKSEIFKFATLHAKPDDRKLYLQQSERFFEASTQQLAQLPTRTLCRPVVLLLSFGWMHNWMRMNPDARKPGPARPTTNFGPIVEFVPQKIVAKKRAKILLAVVGLVTLVILGWLIGQML